MPRQTIDQAYGCKLVTIVSHHDYYRLRIAGGVFSDRHPRYVPLAASKDIDGLRYAQSRQLELQRQLDGSSRDKFDPTLQAYKSWKLIQGADLEQFTPEQCKSLTLRLLWENWCKYKEPLIAASTLKIKFRGTYQNSLIKFGLNEIVNDRTAVSLRNYLIKNLNNQDTINLLNELDNACKRELNLGTGSLQNNPFWDMSRTVANKKNKTIDNRSADEIVQNDGIISFTAKQEQLILEYFSTFQPHYYLFVQFRFLTGMRLGESVEIKWKDITKDFSKIAISRAFDFTTNEVKPTKTGKARVFLCSEKLSNLLHDYYHSLPEIDRANEQLLFTNQYGSRIGSRRFRKIWDKVLQEMVQDGVVPKKLAPKNTRHTFATRARLAGNSSESVARQLGHSVKIEDSSYLDRGQADKPLDL